MPRNEYDANAVLADMVSKEENALNDLLCFVGSGLEYPDAAWKVCSRHGIKADRLQSLYDAQCVMGF